MFLLLLKIIV